GSADGNFYALEEVTGMKRWSFPIGASDTIKMTPAPAIGADGTIYVGSTNGNVYALDGLTGAKKWVLAIGGSVSPPAIGGDGTVYVGSSGANVYALARG